MLGMPLVSDEKPRAQATPPGLVLSQSMVPVRMQGSLETSATVNLRDFVLPVPPSPVAEAETPPPRKQSRIEPEDELHALDEGNGMDDSNNDSFGIRIVSNTFLCVMRLANAGGWNSLVPLTNTCLPFSSQVQPDKYVHDKEREARAGVTGVRGPPPPLCFGDRQGRRLCHIFAEWGHPGFSTFTHSTEVIPKEILHKRHGTGPGRFNTLARCWFGSIPSASLSPPFQHSP
jgi:hypothetical protein